LYKVRNKEIEMNHLSNIATRQRNSRLGDAIFAALIALATVLSVTAVSTVAQAASTHVASK
jgi:hypothetical protein